MGAELVHKIKPLHILGYSIPNMSGYTIRSKYLIESEKRHGLDPLIITSPKYAHEQPFVPLVTYSGIRYFRTKFDYFIPSIPFLNEIFFVYGFRKKINAILNSERVDVIHAHSPSLNGLPCIGLGYSQKRIPLIYHLRALWEEAGVESGRMKKGSLKYHLSTKVENFLIFKASKIITICHGLKNELIKRGIPEDKIIIIENGVDTKKFFPIKPNSKLISKFGIEKKCVVGFIGSFFKFEGVKDLVKSFSEVTKITKDIKLILVGSGEEFDDIKNLIYELNLSNSVIITGRIPHEEIFNYYSIIDILVYPRVRTRLTELVTPLKPLEAMAMGKAVIGSDVGGIKELIQDDVTGVIYSAGDYLMLAKKILQLSKDVTLRKKLGQNALQYVRTKRDWFSLTRKMVEVYKELLIKRETQLF